MMVDTTIDNIVNLLNLNCRSEIRDLILNNGFNRYLLYNYLNLVQDYIRFVKTEHLVSGIIFFYACVLYILHHENYDECISDVVDYNLLYILVDNLIDDPSSDRSFVIKQMTLAISDPSAYLTTNKESEDRIISTISEAAKIYQRLTSKHPNIKRTIVQLFSVEVSPIQFNKAFGTFDEYLKLTKSKGVYTMRVIPVMLNIIDTEAEKIGTCMQLIDDMMDVDEDKALNIETIATLSVNRGEKLDNLYLYLIETINSISNEYILFKFIYNIMASYIPARYPHNFSNRSSDAFSSHIKEYGLLGNLDVYSLIKSSIEKYIDEKQQQTVKPEL